MPTLILIEAISALVIYLVARWAGLRPRPVQIPILLMPVAPPLFGGILGEVFGVEPGALTIYPAWALDALGIAFYASIAISLAVVVFAKGYRIPAAVFALPQIPLAWLIGFLGVMRITGVWI